MYGKNGSLYQHICNRRGFVLARRHFEKQGNAYKSTLFRTIKQGDEIFNDVLSFVTLNEDDFDETTNHFFLENLNECFNWLESNFEVKELKFTPLDNSQIIYTDLLVKGAFDIKK